MVNMKSLCAWFWFFIVPLAVLAQGCLDSSPAFGQVHLLKTSVQSCTEFDCRIVSGTGSAVCVGQVGGEWIFVSAGHCFYDFDSRAGIVKSLCKSVDVAIDEQWVPARFWRFSQPREPVDLAVLSVPASSVPSGRRLKCIPIATQTPAIGSDVVLCGFPSGGKYNESRGTVVETNLESMSGHYCIKPAVVRGVSGGPAIAAGKIVGIASHSDFTEVTVVVGPAPVRSRLIGWLGRIPDCGAPAPGAAPRQSAPQQSAPQSAAPQESVPQEWGNCEGGDAPLWDPSKPNGNGAPPSSGAVAGSHPAPAAEERSASSTSSGGQAADVAGAIASGAAGFAWSTWAVPLIVGALGGGPLGMAAVWLGGKMIRRVASKGAGRVAERVETRVESWRDSGNPAFDATRPVSPSPPPPRYSPHATHTREVVEIPVAVETQSRPAPPRVVRTSEFIPVEVNPDADAYQWAKKRLVEKYPESATAVEVLESYMQQYRSASTRKETVR